MGLVLDSSVLVATERQALPVSTLLERLQRQHTVTQIVLSAISVVELEHGIYRAQSPARKNGIVIPFADILIGGTALHIGYALVTSNVRPSQKIPGLNVIPS